MEIVTVSQNFEIDLPESIREALRIRVGQKFEAQLLEDRVILVPMDDYHESEGSADADHEPPSVFTT